jgi:hypothetical protein
VFDPLLIRRLIGELHAADPQYSMNLPIKARDLIAWERSHGIELPADYRTFLLEVGNGGAGPGAGLWPIGQWAPMTDLLELIDPSLGDLKTPFPHREAWNLSEERLEGPDFDNDDEEDAYNEALNEEYFTSSLVDGAFWICHHGCAIYSLLVVTGDERGNVWRDGRGEYTGISPHTDKAGRRVSFGDWYLDWVTTTLHSLKR